MSMNPHLAYELARSRQEEIRRQAVGRPMRQRDPRQAPSLRRIRPWSFKAPLPRSAPAR